MLLESKFATRPTIIATWGFNNDKGTAIKKFGSLASQAKKIQNKNKNVLPVSQAP